jgi:putative transposase
MNERNVSSGEIYHAYNRGILKNDIFLCHEDYLRFMCLVKITNAEEPKKLSQLLRKRSCEEILKEEWEQKLVKISIGRLMPNHFHLEGSPLSPDSMGKLMHRVLSAYSKYFNNKYRKSGHTFQGKYKFKRVKNEAQALVLRSYIEMNPLKLIRKNYKHEDFLRGKIKLTQKEKDFIKNYPYTL